MEKPICKNCSKGFNPYKLTYSCDQCDDGVSECVRDIDFDGSGYTICRNCKGTGEVTRTETHICSEECWDEYEQKIFNP